MSLHFLTDFSHVLQSYIQDISMGELPHPHPPDSIQFKCYMSSITSKAGIHVNTSHVIVV